ncbi:MAG TPA: CHC2 zinc finger domain-containing protein [Chloroflexota bacterium]|nr:CHC2 zinc finger domain-containing protein [Chloroflexota bacterium]
MARVDNRQISDEEKEQVRRDNPVDQVVRGYGIDLRPEGLRLRGLCPFHNDVNHPNLIVSPDRLLWKCWACDSWGDVYEFVQRKDGVAFPEAFRRLRDRSRGASGLSRAESRARAASSEESSPSRTATRKPWDHLTMAEQAVMNTAGAVYRHALWQEPRALEYVRRRGLPDWAIRQSGLGYADGHSLELHLRRNGGLRVAEQLGLLRPASPGRVCRELLGGRVVVPELRGGQCIWLIGRALRDAEDTPKYLALPGERPALGYERAAGRREVFLCEGVFDYLTATVWRLAAFSICGTALPADRLGFLAGARAIYGLFDPDPAGQAAAERAAQQLGERFRPITLPDGCDLNELGCRSDGRSTFFRLLAEARHALRPDVGQPPVHDQFNQQEVTYANRH